MAADSLDLGTLKVGVSADLSGLTKNLAEGYKQLGLLGNAGAQAGKNIAGQMNPAAQATANVAASAKSLSQQLGQATGPAIEVSKAVGAIATEGLQTSAAMGKLRDEHGRFVKAGVEGSAAVQEAIAGVRNAVTRVGEGLSGSGGLSEGFRAAREEVQSLKETLEGMRVDRAARHVFGIMEAQSAAMEASRGLQDYGKATGSTTAASVGQGLGAATSVLGAGVMGGPIAALIAGVGQVVNAALSATSQLAEGAQQIREAQQRQKEALLESAREASHSLKEATDRLSVSVTAMDTGNTAGFEQARANLDEVSDAYKTSAEKVTDLSEQISAWTKALKHPVGSMTVEQPRRRGDHGATDFVTPEQARQTIADLQARAANTAAERDVLNTRRQAAEKEMESARIQNDAALTLRRLSETLAPLQIAMAGATDWRKALSISGQQSAVYKGAIASDKLGPAEEQQLRQESAQSTASGLNTALQKLMGDWQYRISELTRGAGESGRPEAFAQVRQAVQGLLADLREFGKTAATRAPDDKAIQQEIARAGSTALEGERSAESAAVLAEMGRILSQVERSTSIGLGMFSATKGTPQDLVASKTAAVPGSAELATIAKEIAEIRNSPALTDTQRSDALRTLTQSQNEIAREQVAALAKLASQIAAIGLAAPHTQTHAGALTETAEAQQRLKEVASQLADVMKGSTEQIPEAISLQHDLTDAQKELQRQTQNLTHQMTATQQVMATSFSKLGTDLLGSTGPAGSAIAGALAGADKIKEGLDSQISSINSNLQTQQTAISDAVSKFPSMADSGGQLRTEAVGNAASQSQSAGSDAGAQMAMTMGMGALIGIIESSRQFQFLAQSISKVFADLGSALMPLLNTIYPIIVIIDALAAVLQPLGQMMETILTPFMWLFFQGVKWLGVAVGYVVLAISNAYNAILETIAGFVQAFGDQKDSDWFRAQEVNTQAIYDNIQKLEALNYDDLKKQADAATQALGDFAAGLNAVSGYREANSYYNAMSKHAAGALVSSPEVALIGEAGPEWVVPRSKEMTWARNMLDGAPSSSSSGTTVTVQQTNTFGNVIINDSEAAQSFLSDVLGKATDAIAMAGNFIGGAPRFISAG